MYKRLIVISTILFLAFIPLQATKNSKSVKKTKTQKFLKHAIKEFKPLKHLMHLDLSISQKKKIFTIVKNIRKMKLKNHKRISMSEAFTENNFNKTTLVKALKQKVNLKLKKYFTIFVKSYNILSSKQKRKLNFLIHKKKQKKK